jgi:hypothetical protein
VVRRASVRGREASPAVFAFARPVEINAAGRTVAVEVVEQRVEKV